MQKPNLRPYLIGFLSIFAFVNFIGYHFHEYIRKEWKYNLAASAIGSWLPSYLDKYFKDMGEFPLTEEGIAVLLKPGGTGGKWEAWNGPYWSYYPTRPQYPPQNIDPWGNPYQYRKLHSEPAEFEVWSNGPDGVSGNEDITQDSDHVIQWNTYLDEVENNMNKTEYKILGFILRNMYSIVFLIYSLPLSYYFLTIYKRMHDPNLRVTPTRSWDVFDYFLFNKIKWLIWFWILLLNGFLFYMIYHGMHYFDRFLISSYSHYSINLFYWSLYGLIMICLVPYSKTWLILFSLSLSLWYAIVYAIGKILMLLIENNIMMYEVYEPSVPILYSIQLMNYIYVIPFPFIAYIYWKIIRKNDDWFRFER